METAAYLLGQSNPLRSISDTQLMVFPNEPSSASRPTTVDQVYTSQELLVHHLPLGKDGGHT